MPADVTPLTIAKASAATGIPGRTIRAAAERGELHATKLPGRTGAYILHESGFHQWAAQRLGATA